MRGWVEYVPEATPDRTASCWYVSQLSVVACETEVTADGEAAADATATCELAATGELETVGLAWATCDPEVTAVGEAAAVGAALGSCAGRLHPASAYTTAMLAANLRMYWLWCVACRVRGDEFRPAS
jgi:hypothetical protein